MEVARTDLLFVQNFERMSYCRARTKLKAVSLVCVENSGRLVNMFEVFSMERKESFSENKMGTLCISHYPGKPESWKTPKYSKTLFETKMRCALCFPLICQVSAQLDNPVINKVSFSRLKGTDAALSKRKSWVCEHAARALGFHDSLQRQICIENEYANKGDNSVVMCE